MANIFMFDGNQYEVKTGFIKQKKFKKTTNTFGEIPSHELHDVTFAM